MGSKFHRFLETLILKFVSPKIIQKLFREILNHVTEEEGKIFFLAWMVLCLTLAISFYYKLVNNKIKHVTINMQLYKTRPNKQTGSLIRCHSPIGRQFADGNHAYEL